MRLTVARLGHLGDGIADGPDGPVYVPMALPGEVVEGAVSGNRMDAAKIVTPAPSRVRAPCPHYRACGGCQMMHATEDFTARWKAGVVAAALAAHGIAAEVPPAEAVPPASRRRAVLAGRRTKAGTLIGFHARASGVIVAVSDCLVLHPALMALVPRLGPIVAAGASRKAEVALALTLTDTGVDLAVTGGKPLDESLFQTLAAEAATLDLARLSWEGDVVAERRVPMLRIGRAPVPLPPGAFLQAAAEGEAALVALVRDAVGPARRVVDLFCGLGTFTLPLAETAEVHGVEADGRLTAALDAGWRRAEGLKRVTTEARDLFRRPLMPDELKRADAVVIDPPRAGAEAQCRELARSQVPVIAAVSCNPVTFARDAAILIEGGYRLDWLRVIDQFRFSVHVELAARFSRGHIG